MGKIVITDSFWKSKQELVRKEVIPYQWKALNDEVPGAAPSYCMRNFKIAGDINTCRKNSSYKEKVFDIPMEKWFFEPNNSEEGSFLGFVFQDTDVYKWLEAVAYSLENHPDKELEATADAAVELIAAAQLPDGYLDTLYIINDPTKRLLNLRDKHELYCFGHLAEAAVAYEKATGKKKILEVTERFADFLYNEFVIKDKKGYPGHEIAEMALAKLYEATGNEKYSELAKYLIDHRGEKPYYFDKEFGKITGDGLNYQYHQAHLPVREQKEAVGHAVRAVYLYSGMADIAAKTNDESLLDACRTLFDSIVEKKMYITGGIGSTHAGEAFGAEYDLTNDMAYSETCASIGLMFFANRMLKAERKSKYADAMERALYNCVLDGMAEDGKSFFYVNPLEVNPKRIHANGNMDFVKTVRQKWFGCACCPPNIARVLSSLGDYIITDLSDEVSVNLYIAGHGELENGKGSIEIDANLFENGNVRIKIDTDKKFKLDLRIPEWSPVLGLRVDKESKKISDYYIKDGYIYIDINKSTEIELVFDMTPRLISCNNRVSENTGKAAVMRGPVVYCLEEHDNGKDLHLLSFDKDACFKYESGAITVPGYREAYNESKGTLYSVYSVPEYMKTELKLIPYYRFANRGENEMRIYLNVL